MIAPPHLARAVALIATLCACDGASAPSATGAEVPMLSFTDWTETTELFVELPALRVGGESPCAAHVTILDGFDAPEAGSVTLVLSGGDAPEERFVATEPSAPGIFRPVALPRAAGVRRVRFEIAIGALRAVHELGEVRVHASDAEAIAAAPDDEEPIGRIVFLKEQQWPIEFGTTLVTEGPVARSISAPARVRARDDGEAWVVAPRAGRIRPAAGGSPRLGDRVEIDTLLATLAPELEGADRASLDLAISGASLEVERARRERERLAALVAQGAIPRRRLLDAEHEEAEASAALRASRRQSGQFEIVQRAGRRGGAAIDLRAPLAGTIADVRIAPGAFVEEGTQLFRVIDASARWIEIDVPAIDATVIDGERGGWAVLGDRRVELAPDRFVARAPAIDPESQTLRVVYAAPEGDLLLPGALATAYLRVGEPITALIVPRSALVEDGAAVVAYVQIESEAFERRVVRVVAREGDRAGVTGELRAGERVVSIGAYAVRLAASSGAVPEHGHAH